ncbi:MAG: glycoside hydrolase family 9 protein [Leptolyngbyaceae cyanobacterium]
MMQTRLEISQDWGSGLVGSIRITNDESIAVNDWVLTIETTFDIENLWDAEILERDGNRYTIKAASWNSRLNPGESAQFGFVGNNATSEMHQIEVISEPAPYTPVPVPPPDGETPVTPPENVESPSPGEETGGNDSPTPKPPQESSGEISAGKPIILNGSSPAYGAALQASLLFYEAQRSGNLPDNNRIAWRGDSALKDGTDVGLDLTGGYYDAGDHVKFGFPMASSLTLLAWGGVEYGGAYRASGQLDELMDTLRWGTDYLLRAHVSDGQTTQALYGQVGDAAIDHQYWGRPEDMTMPRPAYSIDPDNPGSDLAAETAAALAAASILFRSTDAAYADELLDNARQLYAFADSYRGRYSDSIPEAQTFYNSWSGYTDELAWGAAWLYRATGEQQYLTQAQQNYSGVDINWTHNWDNKSHGTGVLLSQATGEQRYRNDVERWLDHWATGGIQTTEGGLAWLDRWGSLRYSANTAFLAGVYSDTVNDAGGKYDEFSRRQIDYILGDNPAQQSYVVGIGNNSPEFAHHRAASGTTNINDPAPNQNVIYGALVGGPSSPSDNAYIDDRTDFIANEVALDFNAGYTGAVARLYDQEGGDLLSDAALVGLSQVV